MLQGKKAVIFDLDGTLIDSMRIWTDIDYKFFGERNVPIPKDLPELIDGLSFHETAVYMTEHFPFSESVEEMKKIWIRMAEEEYRDKIFFKPGVEEFLDHLKKLGIRMGIASSNSRHLVDLFLNARNAQDYFDEITTSEDITKGKPDPEIYLLSAKRMDVAPEHCLVFEDIPAGIMAGRNAGMKTVAVEDPYSAHMRDEKIRLADYYVDDFRTLTENK